MKEVAVTKEVVEELLKPTNENILPFSLCATVSLEAAAHLQYRSMTSKVAECVVAYELLTNII